MQQIERGIYFEDSYLGVTLGGLVFSHGTIIVDSPLRAEDARSWRSTLLNQRGGANRLLVNLDAHPDRTLGNRALDCTIVAHHKAAQVFRNRPTIFKGQAVETGSAWELYSDAIGMRWSTPDITFSQSLSLHWGGPGIVLEHHPGPAAGASWVIIREAKVAFVGDAVVLNQPPFLANAELEAWIETLDLLQKDYSDYAIVSGRGGLVDMDAIRKLQDFLQEVSQRLENLSRRNGSPESTEDQLPALLGLLSLPQENRSYYEQRLRYGLYHYYTRRYRSVNIQDDYSMEEQEQ